MAITVTLYSAPEQIVVSETLLVFEVVRSLELISNAEIENNRAMKSWYCFPNEPTRKSVVLQGEYRARLAWNDRSCEILDGSCFREAI